MLCTRSIARSARRAGLSRPRRNFSYTPRLLAEEVRIVEVGPRDGLQNEKTSIPVATKIDLIERLAQTGLQTIEAGSFVSPKWVPQMANSADILSHVLEHPPQSTAPSPITYQWLLPNIKGFDNFLKIHTPASANQAQKQPQPPPSPPQSQPDAPAAPPHEISIFLAATETFSQKNTNRSIAASLSSSAPIFALAKKHNLSVRAYISVALGCPYEGPSTPATHATVASLASSLLSAGAREVSVADTTGMGTPRSTAAMLRALWAAGVAPRDVALHLHDTFGLALVNAVVGLEQGVRVFDAAVAGLGGCPFSPGATGNVATEDLVHCLHGLGLETGVDLHGLSRVGGWVSEELGRENESRAGKAVLARLKAER